MKKPRLLQINVPSPCGENWGEMTPEGKGRFCSNCQKTIVDFSNLSDPELYRLFSRNDSTICGRFHNDQLNKNIQPATQPNPVSKNLSRAAAALFALISMESSSAEDLSRPLPGVVQLANEKNHHNGLPGNFTISGQVQDAHGNPLENAKITIGDSVLAVTDKDGKFEFSLADNANPFTFQVRYPKLAPVARNYHPAMASTQYTIVLGALLAPEYYQGYTMGIAIVDTANMPSISIQLAARNNTLTGETKSLLSELAVWMRNNPMVAIVLNSYISRDQQTNNVKRVQAAIKKFLYDQEGIDTTRIKDKLMKVDGVGSGIIEINACDYSNCNE